MTAATVTRETAHEYSITDIPRLETEIEELRERLGEMRSDDLMGSFWQRRAIREELSSRLAQLAEARVQFPPTPPRRFTYGQASACQALFRQYESDGATPLIQHVGHAYDVMRDMLAMTPAELADEARVPLSVADGLDTWTDKAQPGFMDVLKVGRFFGISIEDVARLVGYKTDEIRDEVIGN